MRLGRKFVGGGCELSLLARRMPSRQIAVRVCWRWILRRWVMVSKLVDCIVVVVVFVARRIYLAQMSSLLSISICRRILAV